MFYKHFGRLYCSMDSVYTLVVCVVKVCTLHKVLVCTVQCALYLQYYTVLCSVHYIVYLLPSIQCAQRGFSYKGNSAGGVLFSSFTATLLHNSVKAKLSDSRSLI